MQVPTGSSFDELTGCGSTETNATGAETGAGDLVDIESFDSGICRRTVFTFSEEAVFSPDLVTVVTSPAGGVNIDYPNDFDVQQDLFEDRSAGFAMQALYWNGGHYLHVNHGQEAALTSVAVLTNPTRIVVDTPTVNAASEPLLGTEVILPGALGEVSLPLAIDGLADGDYELVFLESNREPVPHNCER